MSEGSSDSRSRPFGPLLGLSLCAAVAAIAVLVALPAIASASINSVQLTPDGAVEPGQAMTAHVALSNTPGYQSVALEINATRVECQSRSTAGENLTFHFTAPMEPGDHTITFSGYHGASLDCTGGAQSTVHVPLQVDDPGPNPPPPPTPGTNPDRPSACGSNVTLVLDESAPAAESGRAAAIRAGALAYLHDLSGTGAHVAIVVFSGTARTPELGQGSPDLLVNDTTIAQVFAPFIDGHPHGGVAGYNPNPSHTDRDWAAALDEVQRTPHPGLVTFITAGNPTLPTAGGNPLYAAVEAANEIKLLGSHIFAVGLGGVNHDYLQDISGAGDFAVTANPTDLRQTLFGQILDMCRSTLNVTKLVNNNDGRGFQEAAGWRISATMTHAHQWLNPAAGSKGEATLVTDAHGAAHFHWHTGTDTPEPLTVRETAKPGYAFTAATCHVVDAAGGTTQTTFHAPPASIRVARNGYATCEFRNTRTAAPPGPPAPPPGHGPGGTSPGGNGPGHGAAETTLHVTKSMPGRARVGDRVPVTITVRNVGSHTAHDVTVHESPPGGGRIVAVPAAERATRRHDGTVLRHLGSLKPGHSRRVHATMLITHGGGRLDNRVAVESPNADVALDDALVDVPRHARRHHPPRFTG